MTTTFRRRLLRRLGLGGVAKGVLASYGVHFHTMGRLVARYAYRERKARLRSDSPKRAISIVPGAGNSLSSHQEPEYRPVM